MIVLSRPCSDSTVYVCVCLCVVLVCVCALCCACMCCVVLYVCCVVSVCVVRACCVVHVCCVVHACVCRCTQHSRVWARPRICAFMCVCACMQTCVHVCARMCAFMCVCVHASVALIPCWNWGHFPEQTKLHLPSNLRSWHYVWHAARQRCPPRSTSPLYGSRTMHSWNI